MSNSKPVGSYRLITSKDATHLAADDLAVDGTPIKLKIIDYVVEPVLSPTGRKKDMLCLVFEKAKKKLAVNPTNAKSITRIAGSNKVEDWIGNYIEIYRTTIKAFGDPQCPCIRVKV